jgi:guanine deaminase
MRSHGNQFGICGCLIDAPATGSLRVIRDGAIVIEEGRITEVGDRGTLAAKPRREPIRWPHSARSLVVPGLVDLHTHLPQYPLCGRRRGGDLMEWLRDLVYPAEREFTGKRVAAASKQFFAELGRNGTSTAVVFSSAYEDAAHAAFVAAEELGIRAWIGQVLMDRDGYAPERGPKTSGANVSQSIALHERWNGASDGLLHVAFSPRFALACSGELMAAAAAAAKERDALLQTHLAENRQEVDRVNERFPDDADYAAVYERAGMLGPRTLLAHCIHLSDREIGALAASGAAAVHCPTANLFLGSGAMPMDRLARAGVRVGLGSDVAAGPDLNLWGVMRSAIETQTARSYHDPSARIPSVADVFRCATMGAAEILGLSDRIGSIDIGKEADLTIIDAALLLPTPKDPKPLQDFSGEELLSLAVYRGGPHAVIETLVRGRPIYQAPEQDLF